MAKQQLPVWSVKVTPEQDEFLRQFARQRGFDKDSDFLRWVIEEWVISQGYSWPANPPEHGGKRKGAGRKPKIS